MYGSIRGIQVKASIYPDEEAYLPAKTANYTEEGAADPPAAAFEARMTDTGRG